MAGHEVKTVVVFCSDFRQNQQVIAHCKEAYGEFDTLSFPGACLPFLAEESSQVTGQWLTTLRQLHGNEKVVVIDHLDCGAYKVTYADELAGAPVQHEDHLHRKNFVALQKKFNEDPTLRLLKLEFALYNIPDQRLEVIKL
ncbi:MAG: hypothetical protein A3E37_01085 [Candidatus Andersenbacteria bacterium RIFCSPHIGHO2_12_FULL_46_9]|nr:MAG: hypothetical protein UW94_C0009G0069 [Parcubacteria group bacterium GW2011_GWA2_45_14]OGY34281.1 MAG: hypothetical protein A3B76_00560 [Candidatus Andersenbacteria bacterium RIFCSPHIGHO2_02_FULL_46_16]OGY36632.1 MAG: hypothetical protein A3I08_01230 [Candidatus Andersenbacteria bacterium RIFCSPLOWO2_02_FULL_46_11]OGY37745.1 MAG: hypothetical protein A3E37_01085 [Candidatus Andersenbacteria bacterium RIFCSPHIGHO2_12_FULL_46_9]OGY40466.1 MAG: hypothetical protein A3G57_01000 [Candidatus A